MMKTCLLYCLLKLCSSFSLTVFIFTLSKCTHVHLMPLGPSCFWRKEIYEQTGIFCLCQTIVTIWTYAIIPYVEGLVTGTLMIQRNKTQKSFNSSREEKQCLWLIGGQVQTHSPCYIYFTVVNFIVQSTGKIGGVHYSS